MKILINLHLDGMDTTRGVPRKTGNSGISVWIVKGLDMDGELGNKMRRLLSVKQWIISKDNRFF